MALWQITFNVYPKHGLDFSKFIQSDDGFEEDEDAWKNAAVAIDFFTDIKHILPVGQSWSDSLYVFGNIESNVFEVWIENNHAVSVSFRIDFRTDFEAMVRGLIEFCIQHGLTVLSDELIEMPMNYEAFEAVITKHNQIDTYSRLTKK